MKQKYFPILTFFIVAFLCLFKLGQHPISDWDEARRGINALEVIRTGDLVNSYFKGQPETSNFKPPFSVWCQAVSFKLLGVNELSLRLPAALSMIAAFFVIFKIITMYRSSSFAAWTCLVLASVKGLIGWHAGRTGDTDAILVLFLLISVYFTLQVLDFDKKNSAYGAGFFLGLAFLVKGPAAWVLIPGLILYVSLTKKAEKVIHNGKNWIAFLLAIIFPLGWFIIHKLFGIKLTELHSNENSFDRLFTVDIWERFSIQSNDSKSLFDPQFFFYSLDKTFNLWSYVFLGFLVIGIFKFFRLRSKTINYLIKDERNRLLLLSLCLYMPLAIFLAFAANSHSWYMAPIIPFAGIITFWGIRYYWKRFSVIKFIFLGALVFTLSRQLVLFWQVKPKPQIISANAPTFEQAKTIVQSGNIDQNILCYLYFFEKKMVFDTIPCRLNAGDVLFLSKLNKPEKLCPGMKLISEDEEYMIFK
ncbi:MAG: hypothetical protein GC192_20020 [Bacteroidetes bacterium]|nr:hypothetical protein [Bacteroidota bacterium]